MALAANRIEPPRTVRATQQPDTWGQGLGDATLEVWYYDHPYPHVSLLLFERKTFTDQLGHIIGIESDTWIYDEVTRTPRKHLREVWAWVWLPGVTSRYSLVKVQEETTVYLVAGWMIGGPVNRRTTKAGWVIYDLHPNVTDLTPAQLAAVAEKGWNSLPKTYDSTIEHRIIPSSGRMWKAAADSAAIVEKATAPQRALWRDPFEVEEITIEDDLQKIVQWTYKKNLLQPGSPDVTRTEQLKDPYAVSLPLDLAAPKLKAQPALAAGVRLEITGGGADLKNVDRWFVEHVQNIRPEKYAVYRRVVVQASRTPTGDSYGIWATPPAFHARSIGPVEDTNVTDFAGNPASAIPAQTSYAEPEDPTPPTPDVWERVAEVPNAEVDPMRPGKAVTFDTKVESGSTYEYFAVAILGTQESPGSNHVTVPYTGPLSTFSGIGVTVIEHPDGSLEIDVNGPPIAGLPDGYGRVQKMTAVVAFDTAPGDGWGSGALISDPATFGREAYLRQALRDDLRQHLSVTLTTPLLTVERGQRVVIPEILFTTRGNGLQLDSRIVPGTYLIDGFGWSVSRDKDGKWSIDPGTLELVSP